MRILIPHEVYLESRTLLHGSHQHAHIKNWLADKIPQGERLASFERDSDTELYAVTSPD